MSLPKGLLPIAQLKKLARDVMDASHENRRDFVASNKENYSFAALQETLREQFKLLAPDFYGFQRNQILIFEILTDVIDHILPRRVIEQARRFADVQTVRNGEKKKFKMQVGHGRAKGFISKAANAANYNAFRLDEEWLEVPTFSYGGAVNIQIEQFLDGTADFAELMNIVTTEIEGSIYREARIALETLAMSTAIDNVNKVVAPGFVNGAMDTLLNTVEAYSTSARSQILATPTFARKILTANPNLISDADRSDMREMGWVTRYKGSDVIVLPNSFVDATNRRRVFQDKFAYIFPVSPVAGADEQIIKVVLEGPTQFKTTEQAGADWSTNIHVYKKMGVALATQTPHVGIYDDAAIEFMRRSRINSL